jgi:hypothetical protein
MRTVKQENPMPNAQALFEKIQALPIGRIAEIEDFVASIAAREQERSLTRAAGAASPGLLPLSGTTRKTTPTMPLRNDNASAPGAAPATPNFIAATLMGRDLRPSRH